MNGIITCTSIPIYPLQRVFYPQNLACTPQNDEVAYMLLCTEGTKISNKTKCTPQVQNAVGALLYTITLLLHIIKCLNKQTVSPPPPPKKNPDTDANRNCNSDQKRRQKVDLSLY